MKFAIVVDTVAVRVELNIVAVVSSSDDEVPIVVNDDPYIEVAMVVIVAASVPVPPHSSRVIVTALSRGSFVISTGAADTLV